MVKRLFPTQVYTQNVKSYRSLNLELKDACYQIESADAEGQVWCKANYPLGYTSYGSLDQLFRMSSSFHKLKIHLDKSVKKFAESLDMDTKNHPLHMTTMWININKPKAHHSLHLHPLSSISGTYYVQVPKNSGCLKFEDPRMTCFMGTVPKTAQTSQANKTFYKHQPQEGQIILFESWLRHEVETNLSNQDRVSVSFNYNWF